MKKKFYDKIYNYVLCPGSNKRKILGIIIVLMLSAVIIGLTYRICDWIFLNENLENIVIKMSMYIICSLLIVIVIAKLINTAIPYAYDCYLRKISSKYHPNGKKNKKIKCMYIKRDLTIRKSKNPNLGTIISVSLMMIVLLCSQYKTIGIELELGLLTETLIWLVAIKENINELYIRLDLYIDRPL